MSLLINPSTSWPTLGSTTIPQPTKRPQLELADIVTKHGADFLSHYHVSPAQRRVLSAIAACRTVALGGHVHHCRHCPHTDIAYNSCRNRHCPKCQGSVAAKWMLDREAELLNVPYFHLVFTLPESIAALALQNPRLVYGILFRASSKTLLEVAANPKHLGAKIGFMSVLHTWGQNLHHHPHVHCVVPAGGISADGKKWIHTRKKDFFLPVRVLSRVFRGKFISLLKQAYDRGELELHGRLADLSELKNWNRWLNNAVSKDWVVYAKPPFGGPAVVLKYLARYTHRVAISNYRLRGLKDGRVTFAVKDYANQGRRGVMTLKAEEFLRRFLQHVLPKGLMRIRHFGWMANRVRQTKLSLCRQLLGMNSSQSAAQENQRSATNQDMAPLPELAGSGEQENSPVCPKCQRGRLIMTPFLRVDRAGSKPHRPSRFLSCSVPNAKLNDSS